MSLCIQYARPSSGLDDTEILGLDVAVTNLLRAWFRYGTADKFICRPVDIPSLDHFKQLAAEAGHDADTRCVGLDPRHPKQNMESISVLFRPDSLLGDLTWRRQQLTGSGYAACGVVHTMSGERIARAVGDLCVAPTDHADALICPSTAIRDAVHNLWDMYGDYLGHRLGTKSFRCPVETPVIPLGIDTEKFLKLTTADKRAAQRQALQASDDEMIILFVGRLSFATKAHPLALWQAAERATQQTQKKIRVIMYGYFKPKDMEQHFRDLAAATAQQSRIEFVMNDDARFPDGLWAAADVFASLSENVQESFGLTPIEAMACALPAIVTDWDGYRGSVRDGIDGFLIPTMTPPPSAGMAIAEQYYNEENYGVALIGASQSTVVDVAACTAAIATLANDTPRRRAMGQSGRERATSIFDWQHIIQAYEDLWREQAQKRLSRVAHAATPRHWQAVHPAFPNPFAMFESFPTAPLNPALRIQVVMTVEDLKETLRHPMNFFVPELLAPQDIMLQLIEVIRRAGATTIANIMEAFPANEHDRLWRCLGWMLKFGIAIRI